MNNTTPKKSNEIENSTKSTFGTAKSTFGTAKLIFKSSTFSSTKLNPQIFESSLLTLSSTGGGACHDISAVGINQQISQSNGEIVKPLATVVSRCATTTTTLSTFSSAKPTFSSAKLIVNCTLLIVFCLFFGSNAWGQCTSSPTYAIIGEGNTASNYPIYVNQYGYSSSVSESIYKYDELQAAGITSGEISSISYQCTIAPGNSRKLTVYLAHVDTYFGSWTYDTGHKHYVTSGLTRVVNAKNVTFSNSGWTEITFDNNFTYQGGQDLLVVVIDHTQQIPSLTPQFLCHSTSWFLTTHHEYNSTSNVAGTPAATSFTPNWTANCPSESFTSSRPNIRFKISKSTCLNIPTNIEYQEHPSSVDISWDANGASKWEVRYGTHGFLFPGSGTSVTVTNNSCTLSGLAANTQYDFYIRPICGSCNGEYTHAYSFMTLPSSFAACSWGIRTNIGHNGYDGSFGQFTDDITPFHTSYYYNYSQTIYVAEDFGIGGGTISGMTINQLCGGSISLGGPLKVYMGLTEKNSFSSTSDWIEPDGTWVEVFSASVTLRDGFIHIPFSTPFEYDGRYNLVVTFYDTGSGTQTESTTKAYYSRTASSDYRTLVYRNNSSFTPRQNAATNRIQGYLSASFEICSPRPLCDYVPVSLSATPGDRQVKLTWDMISGATYKLYYGINNPPSDGWVTPQNVTSPYTVPRLTNGRTYYFAIKPTGTGDYCADNPLSSTVSATPECNE